MLIALIFLGALLSISIAQPYTREQVIWLLQSGAYGAVSWDTPGVVDYYMEKINAHQMLPKNSGIPKAADREDIQPLNGTHELKLVYLQYKNIYNVTREIAKPEPPKPVVETCLDTNTTSRLNTLCSVFCSARMLEQIKIAQDAHIWYRDHYDVKWYPARNSSQSEAAEWENRWIGLYQEQIDGCNLCVKVSG